MSKKYRVVRDLQGGEFGMGRDYTAEEWLEQAVDWRDSDDSWGDYGEGVDCYGNKHLDSRSWFIKFWKRMIKDGREQELIDYIADIWALEFEKVPEAEEIPDLAKYLPDITETADLVSKTIPPTKCKITPPRGYKTKGGC